MKKVVEISNELANYIERLDYEQQATRMLLIDAVERGVSDSDAFKRWEERYQESFAAFQIAKGEMEKEYVLPVAEKESVEWTLDYETNTLVIKSKGGEPVE
jgi:hypothetical protein